MSRQARQAFCGLANIVKSSRSQVWHTGRRTFGRPMCLGRQRQTVRQVDAKTNRRTEYRLPVLHFNEPEKTGARSERARRARP
jgi:hypothetical protein